LDDEEEELTHFGQSLSTIDDYDNVGLEDDDTDPEIDEDLKNTALAHFGRGSGFVDEEGKPKTKKEIMLEVMAKSKQMKAERQKAKMEDEQLMEELDKEFRDIQSLITSSGENQPAIAPMEESYAVKNYEAIVYQLASDRRARPTDRLKTEIEIAQEEKERLDILEVNFIIYLSFIYHLLYFLLLILMILKLMFLSFFLFFLFFFFFFNYRYYFLYSKLNFIARQTKKNERSDS
jgi:nucleolar protein 14